MADMFITSLRNRIRAMNSLWAAAAADLTLEQVNHRERPGLLPIAFPFAHFMTGQDQAVSRHFLGEESLWEREGWAGRVGVTVEASPVAPPSPCRSSCASATSTPGAPTRPP